MANDPTPPLPSHDFDQISSLGKYQIQRKVGSGGMGAVYLATDKQLKRIVALKVLPKDKASNQVLVRRFKAEGQAGAQMEHPNIVAVYESGEIDGYLYLAMEFVEGLDAFELLRKRGVIPVKRSLEIIKQVTLALQHAHERQIVHRDIKPSNLMIRERDGVVKLADLGLARIIEDDGESAITKAGTTVGTVDYMSPEQGRDSKAADIRSDIYSLGCTWYHMLAGKPPYPDGDLLNKLRAHALQPVPDPRSLNENVPAGVVAVIQRMMAKKADDRYQTPAQLLADLSSPVLLRGDFSADQLQLLGAAHADTGRSPDAEDEAEDASGPEGGTRRRTASPKPGRASQPAGAGAPRAQRAEADDDEYESGEEEAPASPQKHKPKTRQPANRDSLPTRSSTPRPVVAETDGGLRAKTDRILPGRLDQPLLSEPSGTRIDPNQIKVVLLILIVVTAVGGIFWAIKKFGDSAGGGAVTSNPYASGEASEVPPPVAEGGSPSPADSPTSGSPPVEIVSSTPSTTGPTVPVTPTTRNDMPISADQDRSPFGGIVPHTTSGTGPLAQWVWQARVIAKSEPTHRIRRHSPGEGEFRNLAAALASISGDAVIEFVDEGPHDIPALEMKHAGRWTLRGAEGITPVLILPAAGAAIQAKIGVLAFEGLHLVRMSGQTGAGLRVGSATLALRRCTLTQLGPTATELIVAEAHGRVLLEDTVVQGSGPCCPVSLIGEQSSLAAGQSLLIAGNASAIQIVSKDGINDARHVTLVATACLSGQAGLACLHTGRQPPTCDFHLQKSLLAYLPGHSADAVGVLFRGWSKNTESLERPRVPFVKWSLEQSALVGWPHWTQLNFHDGTDPVDVRDEVAWRTFWRQPTPTGVLVPEGANLRAVADAGALASSEQIQMGLAGIQTQLADAGPKWSALPEPPRPILAHVLAADQRATLPQILESPDPGSTLRFDLKKSTLGRFINSEECPDGSTVVAFGSGLRTIDPFIVRQKRVQIVFEQSEGTPLVLQPGYKTEPNAANPPAWFSVEDGQLTLTQGAFRMVTSKTRTYPERFLQMTGGLAAVRRCRVEGIDANWPIMDTLPSQGHAPPQLLIDQSLVVGTKSIVRVGTEESVVEVRGSILYSSGGVAVTLDAGAAGSQCSLQSSTVSAGKSVYHVLPVGSGSPVQLFAQSTVFQGGGVLSLETDASSIHWWGFENAYASGMKTFLITRGIAKPQDFSSDWVQGWGAGHELLPVYGTNDTLLPTPSSTLSDITPESFQLHADCAAALAGPTGQGLGALLSQVGPSASGVATGTGPTKSPPPKKTVGPKPVNPGF